VSKPAFSADDFSQAHLKKAAVNSGGGVDPKAAAAYEKVYNDCGGNYDKIKDQLKVTWAVRARLSTGPALDGLGSRRARLSTGSALDGLGSRRARGAPPATSPCPAALARPRWPVAALELTRLAAPRSRRPFCPRRPSLSPWTSSRDASRPTERRPRVVVVVVVVGVSLLSVWVDEPPRCLFEFLAERTPVAGLARPSPRGFVSSSTDRASWRLLVSPVVGACPPTVDRTVPFVAQDQDLGLGLPLLHCTACAQRSSSLRPRSPSFAAQRWRWCSGTLDCRGTVRPSPPPPLARGAPPATRTPAGGESATHRHPRERGRATSSRVAGPTAGPTARSRPSLSSHCRPTT